MPNFEHAAPVHPPTITRAALGARGWETLHRLARMRQRSARVECVALIQWALWQSLSGLDVELNRQQLEALLSAETDDERLEQVA